MDSRERVFLALNFEEPDHVPVDFWGSEGFYRSLHQETGLDKAAFLDRHDVDFRYVEGPRYIGPPLAFSADGIRPDIWGVPRQTVHVLTQFGEEIYQEVTHYPLAGARTVEEIDAYDHWPSPDWFDYTPVKAQCEAIRSKGRVVVFMGDRLNRIAQLKPAMYLRGVEQIFMDLAGAPEVAQAILRRLRQFYGEYLSRVLEVADGGIDIVVTGDDFGSQNAPLLSPAMWRQFLGEGFKEYITIIQTCGARSMHHTCGMVTPLVGEMAARGLQILQSLQPEAMVGDYASLKSTYGRHLAFQGGISIQQTLPRGTPKQVREEVRQRVETLATGGGYILCTAHNIQADCSLENVEALLEAYRQEGQYRVEASRKLGDRSCVPGIPPGIPRIATGAWAAMFKEHPRLFGSREYLKELARTKPREYQRLKQVKELFAAGVVNADTTMGASPAGMKELVAAGVVNAVDAIADAEAQGYIGAAMKHVERGPTNAHQDTWVALNHVALTYDSFYDRIAPADRAKMIAWFNAHPGKYTDDENAFHNSTLSKILCYLRIGYATWGENPLAKEFRDYALTKLYEGKVLPVLKQFGAGGGFTECGWYARHSLWHLTQALELARRLDNYDGFALDARFFYQRLAYELYGYPGLWIYGCEQYPMEGDGYNMVDEHSHYGVENHRFGEYPRLMRTVLAQYFRGSPLAGYVASKRRPGSSPEIRMLDFLYEEPPDPARPLSDLPLAHLAEGIGKVYARSDWTDNATWLRFECGDYWTAHQHFEVGNFEIYRHDQLATESGEYMEWGGAHSMNWLIRTVAHNCILVHDPGEQWTNMRDGGRMKYANDAGQAKKWESPAGTLQQWLAKREQFTRGKIVAYENQPQWLYVAGDCTKAYSPEKLGLWMRQIVFLRPGTFVIFDRVVSRKPEFEKTWLLHCRNEPEIAGAQAVIGNGKGELVMQTLLPEGATLRKAEGYTYRGQTFEPPTGPLNAAADRWRVEVAPGKPEEEDLFLHVLFTDGPQKVELVRDGDKVGVKVGSDQVLFSGKLGGELFVGGQRRELPQRVVKTSWE